MDVTFFIQYMIIPVVAGTFGFYIKYLIDYKQSLQSSVNEQRRESYQKFINLVLIFFENEKTKKGLNTDKWLHDMFSFYKVYVVYASPKVIETLSEYMHYLYNQNETESNETPDQPVNLTRLELHFRMMTRVMKAMRTDLGLSNRGLGKDGELLIKMIFTDYYKIFK